MINALLTSRATAPAPAPQPSAPQPAPAPKEIFEWSKALALPEYFYGAGAAALSGLSAYSDRFPTGGVILNPTGIIQNPSWTHNFEAGSLARSVQPAFAAIAGGVCLVRGLCALSEASKTGSATRQALGLIDLGMAATSVLQMVNPGLGSAATFALVVARGSVEAHDSK